MRFLFAALFLVLVASTSLADDEPFTFPTNWGGTGLMETPTARVMREDTYRIGAGEVIPYRWWWAALSPAKGLEIDGRITEIMGTGTRPTGALFQNYGNYKDKALDVKYQLLPEGKYSPAVAVGAMDPQGTRLYSSQYIVASKQIYPFDFTLGMGNGRFGKKPLPRSGDHFRFEMLTDPAAWLRQSNLFGGIQFAPSEKYALMVEYNPIEYDKQVTDPERKAGYFREPVPSHYNFGLRLMPLKWTEIDLSYQRGNRFGLSVSMWFDIGKPLIPIFNAPYKEKPEERVNPLDERLATALASTGFSNIAVDAGAEELWVQAQNDKYYYTPTAIGFIVRAINDIYPGDTGKVHIILTQNGIPSVEFITSMQDIREHSSGRLTDSEFHYLSSLDTSGTSTLAAGRLYPKSFDYQIKPRIETFLNDPSGFFRYRLGAVAQGTYYPWAGASVIASVEGYPIDNVTTTNTPLSIPIRSDDVLYLKKKAQLGALMVEQIIKMPYEIYGRLGAGMLEYEYGGLDAEVAKPLFGGRLMVGLSGSIVKKRTPGTPFGFESAKVIATAGKYDSVIKDYYTTAFVNTRLNVPEQEFSVDLRTGRFLAGDLGTRVTVSKFINGVVISAWYGTTDTSVFKDPFNKGYSDKGITITIPLRLFKGTDSRTTYSFSLSPWTRDVAQDIEHSHPLFDYMNRDTKIYLDKDMGKMY